MPQNNVFPIRYGLTVPRGENLQASEILCEGGLDLTQSIFETRPGFASKLTNFEVALSGGYRRINGFAKYSTTVVPGQGQLLGVIVYYPGQILAARQDASDATKYNIYYGTGTTWTRINPTTTAVTGTTHTNTTIDGLVTTVGLIPGQPVSGTGVVAGTKIATIAGPNSVTLTVATTGSTTTTITFANPLSYTAGMVLQSCFYNWTGTYTQCITDGVNPAYTWNGSTMVLLYTSGSAANPQFCVEFSGYLFVSGYSTNTGAIKISSPLNASDWTSIDGAAEVVIGDTVTGLAIWRQQLIIFSKQSIHRVVGNSTDVTSSSPFTPQQITDRIGCLEGRTIKEINGDLVFLAQDGLRTVSGTFKIGDTEIGSISRPIQSIISEISPISTPCHAVVIRKKTQYRLFYPQAPSVATAATCLGIMASIRRFRDGHEDWEFGQLQGIQLACADSGYMNTGTASTTAEYIVHGGFDGFVYRQEQGGTFSGAAIGEVYTTVPLEFGDHGLRKQLHRITIYATVDSLVPNLQVQIIYDLANPHVLQPPQITLVNLGSGGSAGWDSVGATWDGTLVWDTTGQPQYRQGLQGSGFLAQFQFNSLNTNTSYTIQGLYIEYYPAGRR